MSEQPVETDTKRRMSGGKKAAFWVAGILGTAIAGFASERVQDQLCLKMPTLASMEYAPEETNSVKYSSLESKATQDSFNGKNISFRATYYGETLRIAYSGYIVEDQLKDKVPLNTRAIGFTENSAGPFGANSGELPKFGVFVTLSIAEKLKDLKRGNLVEFEGKAYSVKPGDKLSILPKPLPAPDFASFIVQVTKAEVLRPINHPSGRLLCRVLHRKEVETF